MKNLKTSTKIFAISTIIIAVLISVSFFAMQTKGNKIIAKVNNTKIYTSEVQEKLDKIFSSQNFGGKETKSPRIESLPKEVIKILIKEIYLEKEILNKAKKLNIANLDSVKEQIEDSKNQIIRQAYIEEIAKKEVTKEDVLEKYAKLSDDLKGKKEYLVYHIVTKTKAEAWNAKRALKRGGYKNFDSVAKQYSIDKTSAQKGGELGYVLENNIIEEVAQVIKNLKLNYVSNPVETKFGWHIIKVTEVRDAQALPFDKVKDTIENNLRQEAINKVNSKITDNLDIDILIKLKGDEEEDKEVKDEENHEDDEE